MANHPILRVRAKQGMAFVGCFLASIAVGCSSFNPAFLNLVSSSVGQDSFITLPNPPGFVVLAMVDNAQVGEQLVSFLSQTLNLSDADKRALRPRIRMRLRITYTDGTFQTVEMIDGSGTFVDPSFNAQSLPDLNQNSLTNIVARCDVDSIALEPGTNIEVFIPVELLQYAYVTTTTPGGGSILTLVERGSLAPQFRPLLTDEVDADGNVTLQRNIGVRDVPSPVPNVRCGSVVAVTIKGVLTVPFLNVASGTPPSYNLADTTTIAQIGGRYEVVVTVR